MDSYTAAEGGRGSSGSGDAPVSTSAPDPQFLAFPAVRPGRVRCGSAGIRPLTPEGQLGPDLVSTTYREVELDVWVRRFLVDLDRFIDSTADGPILRRLREHRRLRDANPGAGAVVESAAASGPLTPVLDGRDRIANALAGTLGTILDLPAPSAAAESRRTAGLTAAREQVRHRLAFSFQPFLGTCIVVQDSPGPGFPLRGAVLEIAEPERHRAVSADLPWRVDGVPNRPARVRVPVPLRTLPSLPCVAGQSAVATHPDSPRLEESALWTYRLTLSHSLAPQDQLEIAIDINIRCQTAGMLDPADESPLFGALAQYHAVAESLWRLLDGNGDPVVPAVRDSARQTFVGLAARIAEAWEGDSDVLTPRRRLRTDPEPGFQFSIRVCLPEDEIGPSTPGVACLEVRAIDSFRPAVLGWPQIQVTSADGRRMNLERETVMGARALYRPANDARWPSGDRLQFEFSWPNLNVATHQNAWGRIRVIRNADLLRAGTGSAGRATPRTHPDFVSTTGTLAAPAAVVPLIHSSCELPLEGPEVGPAFKAALKILLPDCPADSPAHVSASYRRPMPGGVVDYVEEPVGMSRVVPINQVPTVLSALLQDWMHAGHLPVPGGQWLVGLTVYSAVDAAHQLPLYCGTFRYPGTTVGPV